MTEANADTTVVCPYRAICSECNGPRALFRVLLNSGEVVEFKDVIDVELTDSELIVTPATGQPASFAREKVYFAGCGRLAVPFLE